MNRIPRVLICAAVPALLAACSSDAINKDSKTSFLDPDDAVRMTDLMAPSLASNPQVAQATANQPITIVIKPIMNDTNEIILPGRKEMYVARLQGLLAREPALQNRFTFVMNRADYETLVRTEGVSSDTLGPVEAAAIEQNRLVPQYALTGRFFALTNVSSQQRSDFYLCSFELTNIATGVIVWKDRYETKKLVKKELLD